MLRKLAHSTEKKKARSLPYTTDEVDPGWTESLDVRSKSRALRGENVGPREKEGLPPTWSQKNESLGA